MNAATPTPGAALVTGAGRRLGLAIADGLAAGGWAVAYHHGRSAEGAQAAVEALLAKRAVVATPTTLETIRREILRDTAARQARERTARMEAARAAARRTQSGVPGGMGQVLRAVEIERLRAEKRPAGWAPAGTPARKLRAGTGAGSLTAGRRARIGKKGCGHPIHGTWRILYILRFETVTRVSTCGCVVRV